MGVGHLLFFSSHGCSGVSGHFILSSRTKFLTLLMLTLSPATLVLSKCCVGRACDIYGLHCGPVDFLAQALFCPSGSDRTGAWWKVLSSESADISILPNPAHTPPTAILPEYHFSFSPLWLFSFPLTSRCMPSDPLRSPGSCSPLLCLNADVNHRNYHSVLHLSSLPLSFLSLCLSSDILSPHHRVFPGAV